jgi:hypothetical protein
MMPDAAEAPGWLRRAAAGVLVLVLGLGPAAAQRTEFDVDWWTVAGGGQGAGGDYAIRSTIAATGAGAMSGGDFAVLGGFWAVCHFVAGDLNCDGAIDAFDVDPFVLALTATAPDYPEYYAQFPDCDVMLADINGDGAINAFDIDPFVQLLVGG